MILNGQRETEKAPGALELSHAEIGAILEAAETLGGLKGRHVRIAVNGTEKIGSQCLDRIPHVLKQLGVASFELRDLVGKTKILKVF